MCALGTLPPQELARFDLENFRDRPVQAELVTKLLLPKDDPAFTSCIVVHGMGGTGKVGEVDSSCTLFFSSHDDCVHLCLEFQPPDGDSSGGAARAARENGVQRYLLADSRRRRGHEQLQKLQLQQKSILT